MNGSLDKEKKIMRKSRKYRRHGLLNDPDDQNPMSGVINIFDVALVLVMALMVVIAMSPHMPDIVNVAKNSTVVKNPGSKDMQIIVKEEGKPIEVLNMTDNIGGGTGEVLGTAYKLADGRVIYVPGDAEGNDTSASANKSVPTKSIPVKSTSN
jgi:hypothetical protein